MSVPRHHRTGRAHGFSASPQKHSRRHIVIEPLEARRFMSAGVPAQLWIDGTSGADTIRLHQSGSVLSVTKNGRATTYNTAPSIAYPDGIAHVTVNGWSGSDTLQADSSVRIPLTLNGGAGNDTLTGGAGDDVLVSMDGGGRDTLTGAGGRDNFWLDTGGADRMTDLSRSDWYHVVGSFLNYRIERRPDVFSTVNVPLALNAQDLADPVAGKGVSGWRDFSDNPLFASAGPTENDVDQNAAADCYFLAPMASVARVDPDVLRSRIADLGDRTYAVHFERNGKSYFVRVDGDLPVTGSGRPYYGGLGAGGSIWAPIIEKAWAFFRRSEGTYASIEFGRAKEVYQALGVSNVHFEDDPAAFRSAPGLLDTIGDILDGGGVVSYWTKGSLPADSQLRTNHVMTAIRVNRSSNGTPLSLVLRDPYKNEPRVTDGSNDGYITITASQAAAAMRGLTWCWV